MRENGPQKLTSDLHMHALPCAYPQLKQYNKNGINDDDVNNVVQVVKTQTHKAQTAGEDGCVTR